MTGDAQQGNGGDITMFVGTGDTFDGGDVTVTAGDTTAAGTKGGDVTILAGDGNSTDAANGGDGGDVISTAGELLGTNSSVDVGSDVVVTAGYASTGKGGDMSLETTRRRAAR